MYHTCTLLTYIAQTVFIYSFNETSPMVENDDNDGIDILDEEVFEI